MNYYDFPACREAFASGQKDARPFVKGSCFYRLRGRTRNHWTLLSFGDVSEAWDQLNEFKAAGDKVQSLNYSEPTAPDFPIRQGPLEWYAEDFPASLVLSGQQAQAKRRAVKLGSIVVPNREEVFRVFDEWCVWAATRHFMVFKGHYISWLNRHLEGITDTTTLIGIKRDGVVEGIFGFESYRGVSQVTIAKHTPQLPAKTLWVLGLCAAGSGLVLCGSTADKLKHDLGMRCQKSWMFDLR